MATGLVLLNRIKQQAHGQHSAFLDWHEFGVGYHGLFLWEAVVSAKSKRGSHVDDANAAVAAFVDALPNPTTCVQCSEGAYSLIGAALLRTGWTSDISLLSQPCIVVRADPRAS